MGLLYHIGKSLLGPAVKPIDVRSFSVRTDVREAGQTVSWGGGIAEVDLLAKIQPISVFRDGVIVRKVPTVDRRNPTFGGHTC